MDLIEEYGLEVDSVPATVKVVHDPDEFVPIYELHFPHIETATQAALETVREKMITELNIEPEEILSFKELANLKKAFIERAIDILSRELPRLPEDKKRILAGLLLHQSLGLGVLEVILQDKNIEEIVMNDANSPVWVYHIRLGWLKTNIYPGDEGQIYNFAASIGRRVGTQINNLNPLMDAYLTTGDRANATLFPISSKGNTLTIRKFARRPWTVTDFIQSGTISLDTAAFLWLAIQYELNVVVSGGTASGKTSLLNALTCFIPPNQRIISIEDTREIQLPKWLHWVPLTTRPPNPEGRGEITMLQLMINALRMRPDRIVVGEIRRGKEAEVLFEAINTGHSVYSTLHANTADETYRRLINPPIGIPEALLQSLQLIVVMHRDRRRGIRRVLEISELIPSSGAKNMNIELNTIFRWIVSEDKTTQLTKSYRALNDIKLFSGMSDEDIERDMAEKREIVEWMVRNDIKDIHEFGRLISEYYRDRKSILSMVRSKKPYKPLEKAGDGGEGAQQVETAARPAEAAAGPGAGEGKGQPERAGTQPKRRDARPAKR
jgi:flagellar protein FlaI